MGFFQGQHVVAKFPDREVNAVVLEVRGSELVVQEEGTQRAETIPAAWCRTD